MALFDDRERDTVIDESYISLPSDGPYCYNKREFARSFEGMCLEPGNNRFKHNLMPMLNKRLSASFYD